MGAHPPAGAPQVASPTVSLKYLGVIGISSRNLGGTFGEYTGDSRGTDGCRQRGLYQPPNLEWSPHHEQVYTSFPIMRITARGRPNLRHAHMDVGFWPQAVRLRIMQAERGYLKKDVYAWPPRP